MEKTIISQDRYKYIASCVRNAGDGLVAEIGVAFVGVVARLASSFPTRTVYAYDTFEGLPKEKWDECDPHLPGDFKSDGADVSLLRFPNVVIRKGIFPDTLGDETGFVVVHLDCDLYQSTLDALKSMGPRMAKGGRIILDDWLWAFCPGVERAVQELGLKAIQTRQWQAEILF